MGAPNRPVRRRRRRRLVSAERELAATAAECGVGPRWVLDPGVAHARTSERGSGASGPREMMHDAAVPDPTTLAIGLSVAIGWNLVTWGVYRLDKARAR